MKRAELGVTQQVTLGLLGFAALSANLRIANQETADFLVRAEFGVAAEGLKITSR